MSHLHAREVASGVVNLGSTCYMNAVLQALAHSPELLSAVECESHYKTCPIAIRNTKRRKLKLEKQKEEETKRKKDADEKSNGNNRPSSGDDARGDCPAIKSEDGSTSTATSTASSTRNHDKAKKTLSPNSYKRRKTNGKTNGIQNTVDHDDEFCLLCEMEKHLMRVHYSGSLGFLEENYDELAIANESTSSAVGTGGSGGTGGPIAPSAFVHGFVTHVAPSFKLGVQEDSHEFLRLLIDGMQKSCMKVKEIKSNEKANNMNRKDDNLAATKVKPENVNDHTIEREEMDSIDQNVATSNIKSMVKQEHDDDDDDDVTNQKISSNDNNDDGNNEYAYRLFRGKVESIVTCSHCGAVSSTIDPIEDIGLEVASTASSSSTYGRYTGRGRNSPPRSSTLSDLTSALQKFIKMEKLDSGYKCEKCGTVGKATKQSKLASIPPILTFHLKRFRYGTRDGSKGYGDPMPPRRRNNELAQLLGTNDLGGSGSAKIEGHVKFGIVVDMHSYLTKELQDELGRNILCKLFAVIVHAGKNSHSGHYICYVRNISKNEWWKMDDSKVTRVSNTEVEAAEAYMLFYRVTKHPISIELSEKEKVVKEQMVKRMAMLQEAKIKNEQDMAKKRIDNHESRLRNNNNNVKKRKRDDPQFKSGEEWIKAKTNIPDSWIPGIRKAQDYISQCINFNSSYFRDIQDEAKECGELGAGPKIGVDEGDIQEKLDISNALKELLRTIIQPHQKEIIPEKNATASLTDKDDTSKEAENGTNGIDSGSTKSKPFLFPILDSNETML